MSTSTVAVPFAEPPWLNGLPSAYYNDSHRKWQKTVRAFVDRVMLPYAGDWEAAGDAPPTLYKTFADNNMLIPNLSAPLPIEALKSVGIHELAGGLKVEDYDYLHTSIYVDELSRCGTGGPAGSVTVGFAFGLPPIIKFGNKQLRDRFVGPLVTGKIRICIAITEPGAGSDVANIETTAVKSADGKHYIVNGAKKWITNGIFSDYASMAVRTGGPGAAGLSMLVVPLKAKGVNMTRIHVGGGRASGTTYIDLDDVQVPVENLIGIEGMGMIYIMQNFNHERLTIAIGVNRQSRVALSAAFEYCLKREAFGKPLMDQPVVRHRLAKAGAVLESHYAWVENIVYQMTKLNHADANRELGGLTALAKAQSGLVIEQCASTAVLLFGGNGYTQSGQGANVERIYREIPGIRIPGGSEDVMLDLSVRQMVKNFQKKLKDLEAANAKL
ncbi:hypothetical protein VE01_07937 [Pseudogymnoascus verrucosus]|uniref:Acyl-CoA dehydrogenase n=1 Tax=Pseudogymnoascus verrucosus TaxID=342668 RepID=A0A1B8GFH8_9PEZI|nr:uncharacterized protein VE01_07937 [Pseudogymnoascus verrucosus]OBT94590.1 hypothetical protein VE01_07937 [Pseudogymnoascus verrucosus]